MDHGRTITVASRNAKKAGELRALVGEGWVVRGLAEWPGAPEVEEDGATFVENAIKKATEVSMHVDGLVLADDSGLEVDALGGAPGVLSARFAGWHGDDAANNRLLLDRLATVATEDRGAQFRCVLAVARGGEVLFTCQGVCRGWIGFSPRGDHGFGYDPLFVPEWEVEPVGSELRFGRTFAEIAAEEKNRRSHRARAMGQLRDWLSAMG